MTDRETVNKTGAHEGHHLPEPLHRYERLRLHAGLAT